MCGRFAITIAQKKILDHYALIDGDSVLFDPVYNASPGMYLPVITSTDGKHLVSARWGLSPGWSSGKSLPRMLINARVETLEHKDTFRDLLRKGRCIIPADGFFEWTSREKDHLPFFFRPAGSDFFSFAGLCDEMTDPDTGNIVRAFVIITTCAGRTVKNVHDRMPCIISAENEREWLEKGLPKEKLGEPWPDRLMEYYPVDRRVNSTSFNDPSVIVPFGNNP